MGMNISTNYSDRIKVTLKKPGGAVIGTLSYSRAKNNYKTKKKRLGYNFKKLSTQIMTAKTINNAGKAVRDARGTLVTLLLKQKNGDYDERELKYAIEHARDMERIAKKRKRHIEEEERARQTGSCFVEDEAEVSEQEEEEEQSEISSDDLEKLERELKQLMEESAQELNQLAKELVDASYEDMAPDDLENLKRRHRAEELRELMEADMKYLKALFDKLAKEKQENKSGSSSGSSNSSNGVSLQLAGVDMPVETAEAPAAAEGANVDVTA